jgi:hypothetical protein
VRPAPEPLQLEPAPLAHAPQAGAGWKEF